MTVQLDVSEEIVRKYHFSDSEEVEKLIRLGLQQLRIEEALLMYRRGLLSIWKAATMAEIPLRDMLLQAAARGYEPEIDEEMLKEEVA